MITNTNKQKGALCGNTERGNGCVFSNWEMWDSHSENMLTAALWLLGCPGWLSLQQDQQLPCPLPGAWPF